MQKQILVDNPEDGITCFDIMGQGHLDSDLSIEMYKVIKLEKNIPLNLLVASESRPSYLIQK